MALSFSQIEGYWVAAGGPSAVAPLAAAIALAESGGNPAAHNGNSGTGDDSWGLWQINMIGSLGPARRSQFGLSSNAQLADPGTNARAAVAISQGGKNFTPWTTYTSGAYRRFYPTGTPPAPDSSVGGAGGNTESDKPQPGVVHVGSGIIGTTIFYAFYGGAVAFGIGLMIFGVYLLTGQTFVSAAPTPRKVVVKAKAAPAKPKKPLADRTYERREPQPYRASNPRPAPRAVPARTAPKRVSSERVDKPRELT